MFLKSIFKTPLWVLSIFTTAKFFGNNPVIGSYRLNKFGLHLFRTILSYSIYKFKQKLFFSHVMSAEDKVFFNENGYLIKENFLPHDEFASLTKEIDNYQGNYRSIIEGTTLTERAFLTEDILKKLPILYNFLTRKNFLSFSRYTSARHERPLAYIEKVTQHHFNIRKNDPQQDMHKDTFHPTVKTWLYISDATDKNGPFIYVPQSHKLTKERLKWEYNLSLLKSSPDQNKKTTKGGAFRISAEDLKTISSKEPMRMCVKKNTLIIADTFGFHCRGKASKSETRTALWTSSRVNPFNPFPGINISFLNRFRDIIQEKYYDYKDRKNNRDII